MVVGCGPWSPFGGFGSASEEVTNFADREQAGVDGSEGQNVRYGSEVDRERLRS